MVGQRLVGQCPFIIIVPDNKSPLFSILQVWQHARGCSPGLSIKDKASFPSYNGRGLFANGNNNTQAGEGRGFVELRQLHYFVNVARRQHVTHAAEEMHVAQSAVSRQIRLLEQELGVDLFVQVGRNVQLTPAGKLFYTRVEHLLGELDKAVLEIRELIDPETGEIRLGFPHSHGVNLIPTVVGLFHRLHPNVKFRFRQGKFDVLIHDLLNNEIDLAFISPFPEDHPELEGEVLLTEQLFAVLPQGHPLAGETELPLEMLKEEPFVLFKEGYSLRTIVMDACAKAGFKPHIGFEGEEADTIRGLVAAGIGVSLLPEMALSVSGVLMPAKVAVSDPPVSRTIGLIHRAGQRLPIVAEMFRRFLLNHFRERPDSKADGGGSAGEPG